LANTLVSLSLAIENVPGTSVEVVVVDNGSVDNTQTVINDWSKRVRFPVQNILEHKPGLSAARNAGIAKANGTVCVFTDDDCTLNSDYLVILNKYLAQDRQPVIRGGKVLLGDPTDLPFTILLGDQAKQLSTPFYPPGFIIGANMVIPREAIQLVGLFDERFGAGTVFKAGEETDYVYRAYRAGVAVEYVPDLIVHHFHGRKDKAAIAFLCQGYFLANGALYAKHFYDTWQLRHFYWDLRAYMSGLLKGDTMFDKDLGITYGQILCANVKGMALYFWVWARKRKRAP
jgi:GT2 family glycosyltransferase